jgi:membrane protease YdiL (CAAX protease family)
VQSEEIRPDIPDPAVPPITAVVSGSTPNDPPWGMLPGFGVWIASVLFIMIVPALFLLPYLATQRGSFAGNEQLIEFAKTDPTSVFLQIAAILPAHLLTLLLAWLVVTRGRKYDFRTSLGWQSGGFQWWHYATVLIGFFLLAGITGYFAPEQENDLTRMLQTSRSVVYVIAFIATFTAPLVEEVVYRGVLYSALQRSIGVPAAFLLATFLFAVVHVPQYWPSFSTIFLLTVLSVTLTAIRVVSKNLLPCIILHTLFNGIQSVFLILFPDGAPKTEIPEQVSAIIHLIHWPW